MSSRGYTQIRRAVTGSGAREYYTETKGSARSGQLATYGSNDPNDLHSDHTFGPAFTYLVLTVLSATMFWLDYVGAGKSAEYPTTYTLMDVQYAAWNWSGMIALYSTAIGVSFIWFWVFTWLTINAGKHHDNACMSGVPTWFTPAKVNALNIFGLVVVDLILAFNAGMMVGVDEVFQISAYMLTSCICVIFMRVSHTTEPVTLLGAFFCRAGAIIVLSLNVSLTDMIIDNRMKSAFIIYAVLVLFMDFMHVLARIFRPLSETRKNARPKTPSLTSRLPSPFQLRGEGGWFYFLMDTFSSGTYPQVEAQEGSNDGTDAAWYVVKGSALACGLHAAGLVTFVTVVFTDTVESYARLDFNVQGMFVWSRAYPLMKWFIPILWGAPTLLYFFQAMTSGFTRRWALSQFDKLSMPGTSLAIAIQDFCIVSLLGPLYMVTAWQEYVFLGCLVAVAALYILCIASQDWYYHVFAALAPLVPFLFVVVRAPKIDYSTLDKTLIGLIFGLYAIRSVYLYARTSVFGFSGSTEGKRDAHGTVWCFGGRRDFMALFAYILPFAQWLLSVVVCIVIMAPKATYYASEADVQAMLPTMITVA